MAIAEQVQNGRLTIAQANEQIASKWSQLIAEDEAAPVGAAALIAVPRMYFDMPPRGRNSETMERVPPSFRHKVKIFAGQGEGRYTLHRLIEQRRRDSTILDWLDKLTADCPRKRVASISDQCLARCPQFGEWPIPASFWRT